MAAEADEVAVPGLSLDTAGEPLLEAAAESGASGEKGSMSGNQILRCKPMIRGRCRRARGFLSSGGQRNRAIGRRGRREVGGRMRGSIELRHRTTRCGLRCAPTQSRALARGTVEGVENLEAANVLRAPQRYLLFVAEGRASRSRALLSRVLDVHKPAGEGVSFNECPGIYDTVLPPRPDMNPWD